MIMKEKTYVEDIDRSMYDFKMMKKMRIKCRRV